jgi:hypothetical protein
MPKKLSISVFLFCFFVATLIGFSDESNVEKSLRIYMGGISTINEEYSGYIVGSEFNVNTLIPINTISSTINVLGLQSPVIDYKNVEKTYLIAEGDEITVFLKDGTYFAGTLLNKDGWEFGYGPIILNLEKYKDTNKYESPYIVINEELIKAIELKNLNNIEKMLTDKSDSMNIMISGTVKSLPITIAYATRNAFRWTSQYIINLDDGSFNGYAEIESNFNLGETNLTLILGSPYMQEIRVESAYSMAEKAETRGMGASFGEITEVGEQWQYPYMGKVELSKNTVTKVPLFSSKFNLREFYFWNGGKTYLKYGFKNVSNNPIANGTLSIYRENKWIGQDVLNWVSVDEESEFIAEIAYDVDITEKTNKEDTSIVTADRIVTTTTKEIDINNYKNKRVEIKIERTLPYSSNFIESNVKPVVEGKNLKWDIIAEANKKYAITYTYETIKLTK